MNPDEDDGQAYQCWLLGEEPEPEELDGFHEVEDVNREEEDDE